MGIAINVAASALIVAGSFCCTGVGYAETQSFEVRLHLDWKGHEEQQRLADKLVKSGDLPLPLVFVNGQLRAMLDKPVSIAYRGKSEPSIDIGILQFIERPLYSLKFYSGPKGEAAGAKLNYPVLSVSESSVAGQVGRTLKIVKQVELNISVQSRKDGAIDIGLPAAPYAEIAKFVSDSKEPVVLGKSLPVQPVGASSDTSSLASYLSDKNMGSISLADRPSSKKFSLYSEYNGFDFKMNSKVYSEIPDMYKSSVFSNWLGATAWLQFFRGQKTEALSLKSIPGSASIFLAGTDQGQKTNSVIYAVRGTWNTIFLRHDNFDDCQVDASSVKPPSSPGKPYTFECRMVKSGP